MNDRTDNYLDVDEFLHPSSAFAHPSEVVGDPDLTLNEKRAILASWASDASAIEAAPELRSCPSGTRVRFDEIMEALRTLDKQANAHNYRGEFHKRGALRRAGQNRSGAGTLLQ
jgi:hypothetical protein